MNSVTPIKNHVILLSVLVLFVTMSYISYSSIVQLQGNARVINYTGIVRGATQRLVKKELQGEPDSALLQMLDSIVNELISGEGEHNLVMLNDKLYQNKIQEVKNSWDILKGEINSKRVGGGKRLFELSEEYFILADETVSAAEYYTEKQVDKLLRIIVIVNLMLMALLVGWALNYFRFINFRKKAEDLDRIAYVDSVSQISNRTSCDKKISWYRENRPKEEICVIVFDMNNLKNVNDKLGHVDGDKMILTFAKILQSACTDSCFVGRYGGDEFLAILTNATPWSVENFFIDINEQIQAYNQETSNANLVLS